MILVDTSVWIDYLRQGNAQLRGLLYQRQVLLHPFVVGELACGSLPDRSEFLEYLEGLPEPPMADHDEVLHLLESKQLYARGVGWVDMHLLASALLARSPLWTLDRPLLLAAQSLNISL